MSDDLVLFYTKSMNLLGFSQDKIKLNSKKIILQHFDKLLPYFFNSLPHAHHSSNFISFQPPYKVYIKFDLNFYWELSIDPTLYSDWKH